MQNISKIHIENLENKTYVDKTRNATSHVDTSPAVAITEETDRIYQGLEPTVPIIVSETDDKRPLFTIGREGMTDVVVWNPWIEKTKTLADLAPDDAYKTMVCVEPGCVSSWPVLEAGDSWEGGQSLKARR